MRTLISNFPDIILQCNVSRIDRDMMGKTILKYVYQKNDITNILEIVSLSKGISDVLLSSVIYHLYDMSCKPQKFEKNSQSSDLVLLNLPFCIRFSKDFLLLLFIKFTLSCVSLFSSYCDNFSLYGHCLVQILIFFNVPFAVV